MRTPKLPSWSGWPYRLGCPVWACKHWGGTVYPAGTNAKNILQWYSSWFAISEGNSTFYGLPSIEQITRWAGDSVTDFEFCFKFPRAISHDKALQNCQEEFDQFLERLQVLAEHKRLGPTFLQLGPSFSGRDFKRLESFLERLPSQWPWAVEVRHQDWFDQGTHEAHLDQLLRSRNIDRVLFDSRPLYSLPPSDASERESQSRKPRSPYRTTVTGSRPMVRLIGRNRDNEVTDYWIEWSKIICDWIDQGLTPYVFTHSPDDRYAPQLARKLHALIQQEYSSRHPSRNPISDFQDVQSLQAEEPTQQMLF